jgi:hypothetical protein
MITRASGPHARAAAACAALALAVAGCTQHGDPGVTPKATPSHTVTSTPASETTVPDRQPRTLVLKATGNARVTSIRYTLDRKVRRRGAVKLPWRQPVTVPVDGDPHSWTLVVKFVGTGHVDLTAILDGAVVARGGSAGSGSGVTGSAGVSGSVGG